MVWRSMSETSARSIEGLVYALLVLDSFSN